MRQVTACTSSRNVQPKRPQAPLVHFTFTAKTPGEVEAKYKNVPRLPSGIGINAAHRDAAWKILAGKLGCTEVQAKATHRLSPPK